MSRACELVMAAGNGDLSGVRKAIEKGAKPTDGNYDKRTALHTAAAEGKIPVVRRLVDEMGAKVNAKDRWEGTPLDDATRGGHKAVMEFLIAKGAVGGKASTPVAEHRLLFDAINAGNVECLRSLLRRKIDVNEGDSDKRTAMHVACAAGHLNVVKVLVEEGNANMSAQDRVGGCPMDDALRCNNKSIAEYLRRKGAQAGQAVVNTEAAAALCDAASKGDINKLRELRSSGVDVNSGDYDMRTAIHLAASEGILPVIEVIVNELGGNQNVTDRWGGTPLDDAIRSGHTEIQEWLECNSGARGHNQMFSDEAGLLCDAASKGDAKVFIGLAKQNANINMPNIDKRTALHIAAAEGSMECVRCLVEDLKVELSPTDRWGLTPLDDAVHGGHEEVVAYLKEVGAQSRRKPSCNDDASFLIEALCYGDMDKLKAHLEQGRDVNSANFDKRTALHVACGMGNLEVVQMLVDEYSAHTSSKDHSGGTPLDDAVEGEFDQIVEFLESRGAPRCRTKPVAAVEEVQEVVHHHQNSEGTTLRRRNSVMHVAAFHHLTASCCGGSADKRSEETTGDDIIAQA